MVSCICLQGGWNIWKERTERSNLWSMWKKERCPIWANKIENGKASFMCPRSIQAATDKLVDRAFIWLLNMWLLIKLWFTTLLTCIIKGLYNRRQNYTFQVRIDKEYKRDICKWFNCPFITRNCYGTSF